MRRLVPTTLLLVLGCFGVLAQARTDDVLLQERAKRLEPLFDQSARRYGIDARILKTICFLESRFRINAISPKGARGPMQFMPATASQYGLQNPHDPRAAIDAAARYLRDLLRRFDGRLDLAIAAYNAGEGAVEAFRSGRSILLSNGKVINPGKITTGGIPPYRETRRYVRSAIFLLRNDSHRSDRTLSFSPTLNSSTRVDRDFSLDVLSITETKHSTSQGRVIFIDVEP